MAGYWPHSFITFMDLDSVSVHNHAKIKLGQYPAILTSPQVSNPYVFTKSKVFVGKSQTEVLLYGVMPQALARSMQQDQSLRLSRKDQTFQAYKYFIIWHCLGKDD